MYSYKTGLGQVWVGAKLPPNPGSNIIWLRPSDDHRVLWEIRTYNIYKERWEVLTSAALTADGLLILIRDLEKRCKSLEELKVVLYDTIQNLTPEEQKIARQNIGAISLEDLHLDENVTRLAIELTINDEKVYSVVTPLETLTEHYRKFLADPTKYVWQLYLKVGEDQLGLVPLFIITYGGLHIGFYSPDLSGETKYVSLNTNGDVVIRATVNNYGPTLVEVVQSTGDSTEKVMSQKAVTEELSKKASLESVTESISVHNTSTTAHADIRELLNTCVGLPAYDSSSYKITFTTLAGATVEIDLPIEQLALRYNAETESIEFDNADGTTTSIPVSAFVKEYVGSIGDRIQVSIDKNNVIHATVLKNSIDWDCLSFELQERINDHVTSADFATKAVRTDIAQTLSAAQQEQALANLGMKVYITDSSFLGSTLSAEEIEEIVASKVLLLTDTGDLFSFGSEDSNRISFYQFTNNYYVGCVTIRKDTYYVSSKINYPYRDTGALHFTVQNPALTTAQQSQAFENLGWKVHVISESAIGSSDAVSDDEKAARLSATALLVQETGEMYIYGHNSSSTPSDRRFYRFRDTKTLALLNVVTTTGLITQPLFVNIYDENAVSFTIDQSSVSDAKKNRALSNIGLNWIHVQYSLLGTTLDDATYTKIKNAYGIILTDAPSEYYGPSEFICGANNSDGAKVFAGLNLANTSAFIVLYTNHSLTTVRYARTYDGAVPYDASKTLTSDQQEVALSNIGLGFVIVDYSELATTLSDDRLSQLVNAKGIILTNTPDDYTRSVVFTAGTRLVNSITFSSVENAQNINYIVLNIPNKVLSLVQTLKLIISNFNQNLTNTEKDTVLSNIGLDFVHVDYSLLGTTLTDEMFAVIDNAKGIILVDISSNYRNPIVFIKGNNGSESCLFVSHGSGTLYCTISLNKSLKFLSRVYTGLTYEGSVRYTGKQDLTDVQKQQARANINAVGSSMIKGVEIVYGAAPMQEDNILYIELEETT